MPSTYLPGRWNDDHQFLGRVASLVNRILRGAHNEVHAVTLAPGVWSTVYPYNALGVPPDLLERITPSTVCLLVPRTTNAASLMYGLIAHTVPVEPVPNVGYVTINHGLTANTNQDFWLVLFGD